MISRKISCDNCGTSGASITGTGEHITLLLLLLFGVRRRWGGTNLPFASFFGVVLEMLEVLDVLGGVEGGVEREADVVVDVVAAASIFVSADLDSLDS